jgi:hypothetical protein
LVLNVYWGLLACYILNQKERESIEHTVLKKMKEQIERLAQEKLHSYQVNANQVSWLMHWVLIYSFTSTQGSNEGLYAQLMTENSSSGHHFMSMLHLNNFQHHLKYLISALLLSTEGRNNSLQDTVL